MILKKENSFDISHFNNFHLFHYENSNWIITMSLHKQGFEIKKNDASPRMIFSTILIFKFDLKLHYNHSLNSSLQKLELVNLINLIIDTKFKSVH